MTSGCEIGMLGYSFYILLFGSENLQNMAMIDLGQVTFCFTCYVATLTGRSQSGFLPMVKNTFKTPIIWAIILPRRPFSAPPGISRSSLPLGYKRYRHGNDRFYLSTSFLRHSVRRRLWNRVEPRNAARPARLSVVVRYVCCAVLCFLTITVIGLLMPMTESCCAGPSSWCLYCRRRIFFLSI